MPSRTANDSQMLLQPRIETNAWIVLVTLTFGYFLVVLYTAIVFTAAAAIEQSLHASFSQLLWILNGFALVFAILLIPGGRLADMYGPKRMYVIGLIWFTLATGACGFARDPNVLIAFRLLQGVGAALLTTQTLSYISRLFRPEQRGAAIGLWGGITAVSGALGPTIGGFLVSNFGWESIFYISLPLGIIGVVAAVFVVPEVSKTQQHHLDPVGIVLLAAGLFSGLYAFIEAEQYAWGPITNAGAFSIGSTRWSLWSIYSCIVYSVILLAIFVWREKRIEEPMLPIPLFRERNFVLGSTIMVLLTFALIGMFTPIILFLETVLGFSAAKAGLTLLPGGLIPIVVAPIGGRLTERLNGKYVLFAGLVASACGFAAISRAVSLDNTQWSLVFPLSIMGLGFGLSFASVITLTMRDVPPALAGAGSGYVNAARQAAGSIGGAVMGTILANQIAASLPKQAAKLAPQLPPSQRAGFVASFRHGAGSLSGGSASARVSSSVPHTVAQQIAALSHQATDRAFLDAMHPTMAVPVVLASIGALLALAMRGSKVTHAELSQVDAQTSFDDQQPRARVSGES